MTVIRTKSLLLISLVAFSLVWPAILTGLYFVWLTNEQGMAARVVFSVGKIIQFALPLVALSLGLISWQFRAPSRRTLWSIAGITLLLVVLVLVLYEHGIRPYLITDFFLASVTVRLATFGIAGPAQYILLAVSYVIGHSYLEEYYWRWFVYGSLRRYLHGWWPIVASSIAFTLHHLVLLVALWGANSAVPYLLASVVFVGGLLWSWLYERQASLWGVWVSHAIVDAGIFLIGFDLM